MAQARKGGAVQSKINMIVYGAHFSGKSTFGAQMALLKRADGRPFRLLVLDAEHGSIDDYMDILFEQGAQLDNIYTVYTQSLEEVNQYIKWATEHADLPVLDDEGNETDEIVLDADGEPFHPDAILVDGSSVLKLTCQQSLLNLTRRRAKIKANRNGLVGEEKALAIEDAQLSQREWGALGYSGQSLVLNLAASGLHWVITCREKAETENRIIDGKKESVNTGRFIPDSFKDVSYNAKTVARMFRDPDEPDVVKMYVEKDRTGIYAAGQVIEDPSILVFQKLINKNLKDVIVKNSMEEAINIESKMYQKSLGIDLDETSEDEIPNAPVADIDAMKKQAKANHAKMNPAQRAEFSKLLKIRGLPTKMSDVTEPGIMVLIIQASEEVLK